MLSIDIKGTIHLEATNQHQLDTMRQAFGEALTAWHRVCNDSYGAEVKVEYTFNVKEEEGGKSNVEIGTSEG